MVVLVRFSCFNHLTHLFQGFDIDVPELPFVVRSDIDGENITKLHGCGVVLVEFFRRVAKVIVFRQGIEPVRTTPVFGKDRISEFGQAKAGGQQGS